jgi:E3 ubiquitin-protein ligase CCNP1IP1
MSLKCNLCWAEVKDTIFVTACHHCFCETDARQSFSQTTECPACERTLTRKDIKEVHLDPTEEFKTIALCGLSPEIVIEICQSSIQFWVTQQKLQVSYERHMRKKAEYKHQQTDKECNDKLVEVESKVKLLNNNTKTMEENQENFQREYKELQEKYQSTTREKVKLSELYNQLKRKHDRLLQESLIVRANTAAPDATDLSTKKVKPPTPFKPFDVSSHSNSARAQTLFSPHTAQENDAASVPHCYHHFNNKATTRH